MSTFGRLKNKIAIVIQARMGSERYPGKMMADICGKPMIQRVVERCEKAKCDALVVATPDNKIIRAIEYQALILKGHPTDCLSRYVEAQKMTEADIIVRITGDCPLVDPWLIDWLVQNHSLGYDFTTNALKRSYPKGFDIEVAWADVIHRIDRMATTDLHRDLHREHVFTFIAHNKHLFSILDMGQEKDWSDIRVCVDTPDDMVLIREIYKAMGNDQWSWRQITEYILGRESV